MRPAVDIEKNELIQFLRTLNLNPDHFVILGSAPLWAHGLRDEPRDLDIVARGIAWWHAIQRCDDLTLQGPLGKTPMACFLGGRIEVFGSWITDDQSLGELIREADVFNGLRFARLEHVLVSKRSLNRAKDQGDIAALDLVLRD